MAIILYFYPYYARIVCICFRLFAILDVKIFELCDKVVKFFWISYISVCVFPSCKTQILEQSAKIFGHVAEYVYLCSQY